MKAKYPVEAYALAMVLITTHFHSALMTGVLILFGTTAGMLARVILGEERRMQDVEMMTTFFCVFGAMYLVSTLLFGEQEIWTTLFGECAIAILAAKFVWQADASLVTDYKTVIIHSVHAIAAMAVIGALREILGLGTLMGYEVISHGIVASGYQHTFFGFIAAGFGIAAVNRFCDVDVSDLESALIIVPCAVIAAPFTIASIPAGLSIALSIFLVIIYLVSVKGRLLYSDTSKYFESLPIELIAVGIVYMILSFF